MKKEWQLTTGASVSLYPASEKYLIYFHGGGFVYGTRQDIPASLIALFQEQQYSVLTVDYLLAPNSSLVEILALNWQNFQELQATVLKDNPFCFCGRSAGGYLMLALTQQLLKEQQRLPEKLVNFYGYTDLSFIENKRVLQQPLLSKEQVPSLNQTEIVWDDPQFQRYLPYVYWVQQQELTTIYGLTAEALSDYAIDPELLVQFPPIFSSASSTDEEVPFRYSKGLKKVPKSKFVPVYDLPHDFLKNVEEPQVQMVFQQLARWLKQ